MSAGGPKESETAKAVDPASVRPGEMLGGKFRVERVVGRGGMGVVIEATNVQLDQRVALKLLATGADDPVMVERFSREARAAARLKSEHVARVYDVGKDTLHGPYIVMEMLDGRTLADVIKAGRVAVSRSAEYVIDACEGLAEAHARGIVHQDVKPPNLFLVTGADGKPSIKLLDFGIAMMRTKERESDTKSSHPSAGTPAYLAPEQLRASGPIDHRADIWALGCVLYELLVGDRAFRAPRFTELVTAILETPPHPFPTDVEIPPQLAAVILQCLEKDPAKRFKSTGELAIKLLPFARRRAHSAVTRAVAHTKNAGIDPDLEIPSTMPPPPDVTEVPSSSALRAARVPSFPEMPIEGESRASTVTPAVVTAPPAGGRKRGGMIVLAAAIVVLIGVGLLVWMPGSTATTTTAASSASSSASPPVTSVAAKEASPGASGATSAPTPATVSAASAASSASSSPTAPNSANSSAGAGVTTAATKPHTRPAPRPSATPSSSPDSDIRLTR